jgi:hypothetical protein
MIQMLCSNVAYLVCTSIIAIGLVSCSREPSAQMAKPQTSSEMLPAYTVGTTYNSVGRVWKMIVVKSRLKDQQLIALGKDLHSKYPGISMEIFDDDEKLREFVDAVLHYPDKSYPYPEKWLRQHHVAMINLMAERGGGRWKIMGGDAYPRGPIEIAYLD